MRLREPGFEVIEKFADGWVVFIRFCERFVEVGEGVRPYTCGVGAGVEMGPQFKVFSFIEDQEVWIAGDCFEQFIWNKDWTGKTRRLACSTAPEHPPGNGMIFELECEVHAGCLRLLEGDGIYPSGGTFHPQ